MRIRNGRQLLNGSLMSSTSMNRAIGFSMVFLACLPLSAGCSSERLASSLLETTTARAQEDALVHDTQGELAAIRRDLQQLASRHPNRKGKPRSCVVKPPR